MKRLIGLIVMGVVLSTVARAIDGAAATAPATHPTFARASEGGDRFGFVDVYVDSGKAGLAAWQVELKATGGDVKFVGIEKGDCPGFQDPPYYDPAAMKGGTRLVIGAFSLGEELPVGKIRVARVHVMVSGAERPVFAAAVMVAGNKDGNRIGGAAASVVEQLGEGAKR